MIKLLRSFIKTIPTLALSMALAVAVWISAVTAADPVSEGPYPRSVEIDLRNQNPGLVVSSTTPAPVTVTLRAPDSVWIEIRADRAAISAWIDLAGLSEGSHAVPVQVQSQHQPSSIVNWLPRTVDITLERLETLELPVRLVTRGDPAIGFRIDDATLSQNTITISGPASLTSQVTDARLSLDLNGVSETVNRLLTVQLLDSSGNPVDGLSVVPDTISVTQPINRLGGFRNLVVKFVSNGQPAVGYRLTNVSVFPPTVTVFSNNPVFVDSLPGFVETNPLDLTGVKDDVEVRLPLTLPNGVEVVSEQGEQTVLVQVSIAAIEDSVTLSGIAVKTINLAPELAAQLSPRTVDVIVSGPVLLLDKLTPQMVNVTVDLSGVGAGTYQLAPRITLSIPELRTQSILPSSIEVVVDVAPTPSPTPTVTPTHRPGR